MKTDYEKLKELLESFGVGVEAGETSRYSVGCKPKEFLELACLEGASKVVGYSYFYTSFRFNKDGSFKNMGAWE